MNEVWSDLHKNYKAQDWVNKPSIFAETAITYFPENGTIIDLGAGLGQDSRYFLERGYKVVSTDLEEAALSDSQSKVPNELKKNINFKKVDLRQKLPFSDDFFDVVYAHLSLHYFDSQTTTHLFNDIGRILKTGGVLALLVNSTSDPEYNTGDELEEDYFQVGEASKRFFDIESTKSFAKDFEIVLLDNLGETYKDQQKDVHNLIRLIAKKPGN